MDFPLNYAIYYTIIVWNWEGRDLHELPNFEVFVTQNRNRFAEVCPQQHCNNLS